MKAPLRFLLIFHFAICIFQFGALSAPPVVSVSNPNVLFIAVDDMNDWVGCLDGHPQTRTPNIDRLAKRGMLFTNAHCPSPLCGPSRAAVMTGLRPSTTGVYGNHQWIRPNLPEVKTIPEHFNANNYYVAGAGKVFHHTAGSNPPDQWNQFRRMTYDDPWDRESRINYPWTEVAPKPEGHPFSGLWMGHEGDWGAIPNLAEDDYSDAKSVEYCAEFLDTYQQEKPFFLACGLFHPHLPWYAPQKYFDQFPLESIELPALKEDDLDDLPPEAMKVAKTFAAYYAKIKDSGKYREAVRAYLANIAFADAQVGRLLKALDDSGHAENTIIVFWSDHGWHLGEKQRWLKAALWERTTRVPFIIAAPGVTSPGSTSSRPVNLVDIYATLNELCGLPEKSLDSESLVPLLRDSDREWHPTLTTFKYGNHSIRSERFRYTRYNGGDEEVYDLQSDPNEWNNLADTGRGNQVAAELGSYLPDTNADDLPLKGAFEFDPEAYSWTRKEVAKPEPLKTVIVIGQSNAVGRRTEIEGLDKNYHYLENVQHFAHENAQAGRDLPTIPYVNDGQWKSGLYAQSDYIGPEFGFCKEWDGIVGLFKFTCGATSIASHWRPRDRSENGLATRLVTLLKKAQETRDLEIVAVLWNQGENDSQYEDLAGLYGENLDALIERLRTDLNQPRLPFIAARINPPLGRYSHAMKIRKAQEQERDYYDWIDLDELEKSADNLHFTSASQLKQGRLFYEAYRKMNLSE